MNQSIKPGQTRVFTRQWGSWPPGVKIHIEQVSSGSICFTGPLLKAGHFGFYTNNGELDSHTPWHGLAHFLQIDMKTGKIPDNVGLPRMQGYIRKLTKKEREQQKEFGLVKVGPGGRISPK